MEPIRASLPLNRWLGLEEKTQALYQVTEIYPRANRDLGVYRYGQELLYDMPTDTAVILAVVPAPDGSQPQRPEKTVPGKDRVVISAFIVNK